MPGSRTAYRAAIRLIRGEFGWFEARITACSMFPVLQAKLARYEELERLLQDPQVLADTAKMVELQREHGGLSKVALAVREFQQLEADLATAQELVSSASDPMEAEYARQELAALQQRYDALRMELEDMVTAGDRKSVV